MPACLKPTAPAPAIASPTLAIMLLALAASSLRAQSTLPATPPTSLPTSQNATSTGVSKVASPHRAQVTFADGLLNVRANDSSLNQILHAVSRLTGMTITGGVADQRVFGNYGPDSPAAVLAILLDGTGTNMLLREGSASTPVELVLTPRGGGPTPPNPNAAGFDDNPRDDEDDHSRTRQQDDRPQSAIQPTPQANHPNQPPPPIGFPGQAQAPIQPTTQPLAAQQQPAHQSSSFPQQREQEQQEPQPHLSAPAPAAQPANNVLGSSLNTTPTASQIPTTNSVPTDAVPTPSTTVSNDPGIVDTPNLPAPGSTTGTAPPGPSTPEQIYQQLLKLQQKQQQTTTPAAPATPPQ